MLRYESNLEAKGFVFDIQRFSVHDGPGIRTIVFLKGCPLSCHWCSNPESQCKEPQIMFLSRNCIGCRRCYEVCGKGAIDFNLSWRVNQDKCVKCGKCVENCYTDALNMMGAMKTVDEIIEELKKDNIHYRRSGGGITLSGGEALAQPKFTEELLKACKENHWHTAVETTAFTSENVLERILPWLDLVMLDIKHMESNKHIEYTGQPNNTILHNAEVISKYGIPLIIRVPVIPGVNSDDANIRATANFAISLRSVKELHLLPYHRLGQNKYDYLGREYKMEKLEPPTKDFMNHLKQIVEKCGLQCKISGID